jgi:oxygen-independent coproporphyrinogen-3 oxidase
MEPGTVFFHRPPPVPDEDAMWEIQLSCQAILASSGYEQYEVSAYSQAGRWCRHNVNYWQFGDYLGLGAGAHGKLTDAATGAIWRTQRQKQPREYLSTSNAVARLSEQRVVKDCELPFEFALNVLRLKSPWTSAQFEARTGLPIGAIAAPLQAARARHLLTGSNEGGWQPTELGQRFLNDLQSIFLLEESK